MIQQATNVTAVGAVSSPIWLPSLAQASELAGLILPILGCLWLIIQIVGYLNKKNHDK